MKKAQSILLAILLIKNGWSQEWKSPQVMGVINDIPMVIETTPSAISFDGNYTFSMLPGKLSLSLMARKQWVDFDHMIQLGKPKKIDDFQALQMTVIANQKERIRKTVSYKELPTKLLDTFLQQGDEWIISLESNNRTIIEYRFTGSNSKPTIEGYRLIQYFDSSNIANRTKQRGFEKAVAKQFTKLPSHSIEFPPGTIPEFKLNTYPLLKDSMILYRISDRSIMGPWKKTHTFLTLPNLIHDNDYQLELKFMGQQQSNVYNIRIQPFWYQTAMAKFAALMVALILIILLTGWYYRNRLRNSLAQRQRLEEQLRTIQSQLNPHFIFNALSSIEGLVTEGHAKLANDYLNNFSAIMRATLNNADKLFISLQQELELLEKYIRIEQLRFGFTYHLLIANDLQQGIIEVPPMLLQPLAENAIKHGITKTDGEKTIDISLTKKENNLLCTITNPAIPGQRSGNTAGVYGLGFTHQRLEHFKRLHPDTPIYFSFEIKDGKAITQLVYTNWFD